MFGELRRGKKSRGDLFLAGGKIFFANSAESVGVLAGRAGEPGYKHGDIEELAEKCLVRDGKSLLNTVACGQ
jgi:hypothetical protein